MPESGGWQGMENLSKPLRDIGIGLLLIATPHAFAGPVQGGDKSAAPPPVEHGKRWLIYADLGFSEPRDPDRAV
jgi:hypothetical protein